MSKRTLEVEEAVRIRDDRRSKEIAKHPSKMISVQVDDETDDEGRPVVRVHFIGEYPLPKDWRCSKA